MTTSSGSKQRRFAHPFWTHLPAAAAGIAFIIFVIVNSPFPANVPVHFDSHGAPNGYGSPWGLVSLLLGLSVLLIVISIIIDELWARQEKKKSFNWLCWLDSLTVGWMAGIGIDTLRYIKSGTYLYIANWGLIGGIAGGALLLSLLLEAVRPYRPYGRKALDYETPVSETELSKQLKSDTAFVYWDNQNPFWVTLAAVLLPLIFIGATIAVWAGEGLVLFVILFLVLSVLMTIASITFIYGGQRNIVTRREFTVRWGLAGIKVLRLDTAGIEAAEVMEFAPLRDFAGYGIRYGKGMTAYFLRGGRGVKITAVNGKKYLVGSDHPERLLGVRPLVTGKK